MTSQCACSAHATSVAHATERKVEPRDTDTSRKAVGNAELGLVAVQPFAFKAIPDDREGGAL